MKVLIMSLFLTLNFNSFFLSEFLILCSLLSTPIIWSSKENYWMMSSMMFMTDNLSSPLILLSIWLMSLMIYSSLNTTMKKLSNLILLILLFLLLLFFSVCKMIYFYILFELTIIPTMMIIVGWGYQPERFEASLYFFFYTVVASFPLLISMIWIDSFFFFSNFLNWPHFFGLMMILAFLTKIPIFFLHSWLPKAHVEAPLVGSMLLAGILLKMGGYGILRLESFFYTNLIIVTSSISILGMIYASLMSMIQSDSKAFVAFSSVSHMNFLILGLMSMKNLSFSGSMMLMISHGLVSSLLFFLVNELYYFSNSRMLMVNKFFGLSSPFLMMMWFISLLFNLAIPPSVGMMSEILISMSILSMWFFSLFFLGFYFFMSAFYSIYLYMYLTHGYAEKIPSLPPVSLKSLFIFLGHVFPLIMLIFNLDILK